MQVACYRSRMVCALWILAALLLSGTASAQTGKISGKVVDAQSRQALPGVNVIIEGSTLGAATDAEGDYFILNVSPGTYELKASMIGYAVQTKTNVLVQQDRTVVVDFAMGTQAVQGEEVTISAEREIIQMDLSTSAVHMQAEEFTTAPVTQVADYLQIQEGIEFEQNSEGKWLSIRGGGREEIEFFVDGLSTVNQMGSQAYMAVSKTAIKEVSIQTGGFNAEYGRVRSGLVNVVTLDGARSEYTMALEGKYSFPHLKHFGRNLFDRNAPYLTDRTGLTNFIPDDKVTAAGNYALANGRYADGQSYGLNGEVLIDPNSPQYRGWRVNYNADGTFNNYTEQFDLNGNGTLDPYSAEEMTRYNMDPIGTYPQDRQFEGWKILSNQLFATSNRTDDLHPADLVGEFIVQHPGIEYGNKPDYDMDVTISGPLPGESMNNRLGNLLARSTFMLSYRTQTSQFVYPGSRTAFKDRNLQAKITTTITPTTKLRLSALYGEAYSMNNGRDDQRDPGWEERYSSSGFYEKSQQRGPSDVPSGVRNGGRIGNDLGRGFGSIFADGQTLLNNSYMFQGAAKLTHTINPSTYFEMEYHFTRNIDHQNPMTPVNGGLEPGAGYPLQYFIYNKTDGAGNLLMNERGEPRTFITDDPDLLFADGVSQRFDPVMKSLWDQDTATLTGVPATNKNARNRVFSTGGYGTWPFSMELASAWFDDNYDQSVARKGPNKRDMVLGVDASGNPVEWVDAELLPGNWDYDNILNLNRQPNLFASGNGGLMYNATLPGFALVDGYRHAGGAGSSTARGGFSAGGTGNNIDRTDLQTHAARMTLVSQVNKYNQIKAGFDLWFYQAQSMTSFFNGAPWVNDGSFGPAVEPDERNNIAGNYVFGWNQYDDNPVELAAYLQDKIEVQGLIANVGVRMDFFDPTIRAFNFDNPYSDQFGRNTIYADPTELNSHFASLRDVRGNVQIKFSPRLGLSFPVTEASKVYYNYGWFYQRPSLHTIFQYYTARQEPQRVQIPNVNLEWPRTVQMEMGFEQNVKGWFLLHAAGYYKDADNLSQVKEWDGAGFANGLRSNVASGYSDIRGLELRLDKNYGLFRSRLNYNYLIKTRGRTEPDNSSFDPDQRYAEQEAFIRALAAERAEPRPTFRGTLGFFAPKSWGPRIGDRMYPLDNLVVNMIYRWQDGGDRRVYAGIIPSEDFYVDNVDLTLTDLRAEKRINLGRRMQLGLFVQIYNLFDQKYLTDNITGNAALTVDEISDYRDAIQYDHDTSPIRGNDKFGDYKAPHLSAVLPWWKDNILWDDKRDVFYGLTFTFN